MSTEYAALQKVVKRSNLLNVMAKLSACLVGMEACGGAHHWSCAFRQFGHEVKIINPQYVKPYVKTQKNDYNDAQAICEAVGRPHMHFVAIKQVEHQDILALHRIRSRLVGSRTALVNQIRGLLAEYGLVMPQQIGQVRRRVPGIIDDVDNGLTTQFREALAALYEELVELDGRVRAVTDKINAVCVSNPGSQRLAAVEGIGPISATALIAALGDAQVFRNGRQVSAWLGLVPRQYSSGGKTVLLGITKRGDRYLRMLLIHGARSVVTAAVRKTDTRSRWINLLSCYLQGIYERPLAPGVNSLLMCGPEMSKSDRAHIAETASQCTNVIVNEFTDEMASYVNAAEVVVSMGGYNTICEILAFRKRAIIVPRIHPVTEQWIRAQRMEERGLLRVIHPLELSPQKLWEAVSRELSFASVSTSDLYRADLSGLDRVTQWIRALLRDETLEKDVKLRIVGGAQ